MSKRAAAATLIAVTAFSLIWGYNWVVMKKALDYASAVDFAALRTGFGAASLFLVMLILRRPLRPAAPGLTALLGLLQTGLFTALVNASLTGSGAGKTAVLTYTMPFWTLLLSRLMLGERIARRQWLPILIAFCGLALVLGTAAGSTAASGAGALAVAAGLTWAAASVLAKVIRQRSAPDLLSLTAWQMVAGALALAVVSALAPGRSVEWSPYFVAALVYNAVLATALAWLLWLFVLARLSAGMAGMATLAIPVIGVLAAALELGERPGPIEATGMLAIVAGLALLALVTRSAPPHGQSPADRTAHAKAAPARRPHER